MKFSAPLAAKWIVAYVALALGPLALALIGPVPPPRPFLVEFGVGLGFVGMGLLGMQFVTTGRFRSIAPVFGADVVLRFHRQIGIVTVLIVLAHPVVLIASDRDALAYFDPRVNVLRALALGTVVPALLLLLATSLWRERMRLEYEWWRAAHGVLSMLILFIGTVHGIQVGEHLGATWKQGLWAGASAGLLSLVLYSRVVRPLRMRRRPYRITEVIEEAADTWTLALEPDGHDGMQYRAGQFAWITVGDSPFSIQQHPFSFSSSERSPGPSFTAKAIGDFTSSWEHLEPGQRVFLEGPYGGFILDAESEGAVFIVGGIGITPAMSILRTMRDTGDRRHVELLYGNTDADVVTFERELCDLQEELDLVVTHVFEEGHSGWTGEVGFIDRGVLRRRLPTDRNAFEYFICGPEPLMDAAEGALREMGVSWRQIYSERFQIV